MRVPVDHSNRGAEDRDADIVIVGDVASMALAAGLRYATVRRVDPAGPEDTDHSLERTLRSIRIGVVLVVMPPADAATIAQVAVLRRERAGIRAVLVDQQSVADMRLAALQAGFDEALPLQLGGCEIAGRLAIQLARARAVSPLRLRVGVGVELDLEARALRRRGRFVHLRPLEFRLLEELARAPGRPLSRSWLIGRAWGAAPPAGSRTIDVHVRWLREKVERDPDRPVHILTVRGVGYQLEPDDPDDPSTDLVPRGGDHG